LFGGGYFSFLFLEVGGLLRSRESSENAPDRGDLSLANKTPARDFLLLSGDDTTLDDLSLIDGNLRFGTDFRFCRLKMGEKEKRDGP
jgi:hypothetical protein